MEGMVLNVARAAAPFALGTTVGFLVTLHAFHRWFITQATSGGRDFLPSLKRFGIQSLMLALVLVAVGGNWLAQFLPGHTAVDTAQNALWGLPFGYFAGFRWMLRRNER